MNRINERLLLKVEKYMLDNYMFQEGDKIVLGVSGGADSMSLLDIMLNFLEKYKLSLYVVHVNHGIRGLEADEDEQFVKDECDKYKVPCYTFKYDVEEYARDNKISSEEAGRELRYLSFRQIKDKVGASKIAVAHTSNDSAETILFNIIRGTGLTGIKGIMPVNGDIIRPILCMTCSEVYEYVEQGNLSYRTDITNFEEEYTRNKIRLNVLPYMEKNINSKVIEHIINLGELVRYTEDFMDRYAENIYSRVVLKKAFAESDEYLIDANLLKVEDPIIQQKVIRKVLYELIGRLKDITKVHIDSIIQLTDSQVGKKIELPYGVVCEKNYDYLSLYFSACKYKSFDDMGDLLYEEVQIGKEYYIDSIRKFISFELINYTPDMEIPKNDYTKWFDYDRIDGNLVLRTRKIGDVIKTREVGGTKKLKDLMIDMKIYRGMRDGIPVVAVDSNVLWLVGYRSSEGYKVSETTNRVLQMRVYSARDN